MKTIKLSEGNFDQMNTFTISNLRGRGKCSLHQDYEKDGDGIYWVMQHGACLQAHYSDADKAENARLSQPESAISDGEIVLIDGKQFKLRFLGNFSDCALFDPITE